MGYLDDGPRDWGFGPDDGDYGSSEPNCPNYERWVCPSDCKGYCTKKKPERHEYDEPVGFDGDVVIDDYDRAVENGDVDDKGYDSEGNRYDSRGDKW